MNREDGHSQVVRDSVRELGGTIGYGRMMQLCEKLWREAEVDHGAPGSEHSRYCCAGLLFPCPGKQHVPGFEVVEEDRSDAHCDWCCGAGRVTERVALAMACEADPVQQERQLKAYNARHAVLAQSGVLGKLSAEERRELKQIRRAIDVIEVSQLGPSFRRIEAAISELKSLEKLTPEIQIEKVRELLATVDRVKIPCSFCSKTSHEVRAMVAGGDVFICNECVDFCSDIMKTGHIYGEAAIQY